MPHRFSRIVGTWRIGERFFERAGLVAPAAPPRGLVDRLEDLAGPDVDCARVPVAMRAFFEDPSSLELYVRSRWRAPFGALWRLGRVVMGAIGQLHLPRDTAHVRTRMIALDGAREGRVDARGVVRSYADTGSVFQVFAYGVARTSHGARMSVAIPLPMGHLAGLLRLDVARGRASLTLTSRRATREDASGVWFVSPLGALRLPLEETVRFWSPDAPDVPVPASERAWPDATLVAIHEQRLFGRVLVEHEYLFRPVR